VVGVKREVLPKHARGASRVAARCWDREPGKNAIRMRATCNKHCVWPNQEGEFAPFAWLSCCSPSSWWDLVIVGLADCLREEERGVYCCYQMVGRF